MSGHGVVKSVLDPTCTQEAWVGMLSSAMAFSHGPAVYFHDGPLAGQSPRHLSTIMHQVSHETDTSLP